MANRSQVQQLTNCPVDPVVAASALLLLLSGLVMVASASSEISARLYGNTFQLFTKHLVYICVAVSAGFLTMSVPINIWQKLSTPLIGFGFVLLVAVLVPGVGREVNGATRWIPLGFFTLQGSEFVKLFAVLYIAAYLVNNKESVENSFVEFLKPLALIAVLSVLLLGQPDFGAVVVIVSAVMGIVFMSGVPLRFFMPVLTVAGAGVGLLVVLQPYRLARLTAFTDPWQHQFSGGYQLTQALIAFGRGEWFGLGLGNSIQKLFFLPEAHTDFLFSIVAEELGIVGASLIVVVFASLIVRVLWIGRKSLLQGAEFHAYVAYGIALLLGVQAAINLGVNLGLLPTKGLTLPLVSFGGNSLIISCILIAIALRIDYENREMASTVKSPKRRIKRV